MARYARAILVADKDYDVKEFVGEFPLKSKQLVSYDTLPG